MQQHPERLWLRREQRRSDRIDQRSPSRRSGGRVPRIREARGILAAAAILLVAGGGAAGPARAQDGDAGVLDVISDLFTETDDRRINVPKRRKPPPKAPAATDAAAAPAPLPEPVPVPKRQPSRPAAPIPAPDLLPAAAAAPPEPVLAPADPATGPTDLPGIRAGGGQAQVLQATEDLIAEVEILRDEFAINDYPPRAELIEGRAPVHVYAKSLEVFRKVAQVQQRMGLPRASVGSLPVKVIDDADVLAHIQSALHGLRSVKSQMGIDAQIEPAPLRSGGTASMSYRNLADASLKLDGLVGRSLTPDDVYSNALSALDELALVAQQVGVALSFDLPPVERETAPGDVAAQILRATYKAINLQTRLQMESSSVPNMTLVRVSPAENYDATNLLLAEIARIKAHLGVDRARAERADLPTNQRSRDVFALVSLIAGNIDAVAAAVGN